MGIKWEDFKVWVFVNNEPEFQRWYREKYNIESIPWDYLKPYYGVLYK